MRQYPRLHGIFGRPVKDILERLSFEFNYATVHGEIHEVTAEEALALAVHYTDRCWLKGFGGPAVVRETQIEKSAIPF